MLQLLSLRSGLLRLHRSLWAAVALGCMVVSWVLPADAEEPVLRAPAQHKMPARQMLNSTAVAEGARPADANRRLSPLLPRQRAVLEAHGRQLSKELLGALRNNRGGSRAQQQVRRIVENGMRQTVRITAPRDPETLLTQTMFAALGGLQDDLRTFAERIQDKGNAKAAIREEMAMLQDELGDWPDDGSTRTLTYTQLVMQPDGSYSFIEKTQTLTKDQAKNLLDSMEALLATQSDLTQRDMLSLQDAMNKQAQLMQMMSNLQKSFHDTAMAMIRNLR